MGGKNEEIARRVRSVSERRAGQDGHTTGWTWQGRSQRSICVCRVPPREPPFPLPDISSVFRPTTASLARAVLAVVSSFPSPFCPHQLQSVRRDPRASNRARRRCRMCRGPGNAPPAKARRLGGTVADGPRARQPTQARPLTRATRAPCRAAGPCHRPAIYPQRPPRGG